MNAKLVFSFNFTLTRRVGLFEHQGKSFFCLAGFDRATRFAGLDDEELTGGIFTTVMAELQPKPIASTSTIRNIVEAQDRANTGIDYKGHPLGLMSSIFPALKIFSFSPVSELEAYRIFFRFCAMECDNGDFWIQSHLVAALIDLCDLEAIRVPYQTLCRSIFDADQAALFLSLYRCLEALYAMHSARKVAHDFNLTAEWTDIAITLESRLGWRAPEASSLNQLLSYCDEETLRGVFLALQVQIAPDTGSLKDSAGRQIYLLRNALVHYRPIHQRSEYKDVDWNQLCVVMTIIVKTIYGKLFVNPDAIE